MLLPLVFLMLGSLSEGFAPQIDRPTRRESQLQAETEVVLLGPGDLRVDDHGGLQAALQEDGEVVPLVLLDPKVLAKLPGALSYTLDTARMLSAALSQLYDNLNGKLSIQWVSGTWTDTIVDLVDSDTRVHVCDLGPADNAMGYGSYAQLIKEGTPLELAPWRDDLRAAPWLKLETIPNEYPAYESQYMRESPKEPIEMKFGTDDFLAGSGSHVPTAQEIVTAIQKQVALDEEKLEAEQGTGLYATHWGGLVPETVGCQTASHVVRSYVEEANEDEKNWAGHPNFPAPTRHPLSLEHATMEWQGRATWLAGESMVRYLAAPLLLGTVSPRRVWHMAKEKGFLFVNPLKRLIEAREWHKLLAAHSMHNGLNAEHGAVYKYWRYHGFLARYAITTLSNKADDATKSGILLVHGFGASGGQWNKLMSNLKKCGATEGASPDLLGFGQTEKPALSYTGYLWDSMMLDFVKEVAMPNYGWTSYITGGNSIGGFTSLSLAASDAGNVGQVTSNGAPGTGLCNGLVLMNSAGPLITREEANQQKMEMSIAQLTLDDRLPPCSPPPRLVGRAFGNVLLSYLRPRIQWICQNLYPTNPEAVDDKLCSEIKRDSLDPGAINVMMAGAKLPKPRSANELLGADFGGPPTSSHESYFPGNVLVAQVEPILNTNAGVLDPLNDSQDRMERLGSMRAKVTIDPIQAGHCPHDELPLEVGASIRKWMSANLSDAMEGKKRASSRAAN